MASTKETADKLNEDNKINVLSFDGGGSRGVMEVVILRDVMNFATLLKNAPNKLNFLHRGKYLVKLRELLDSVKKAIHPTEVFKFIIGTSTGALIAFGLVGGKVTENGRQPLTVDEVIAMYKKYTKEIFAKRVKERHWIRWIEDKVAGLACPFPTEPYLQEGLGNLLQTYFDHITLAGFPKPNGCIAGAVARQIFEDRPDKMVCFTSGKDDYRRVTDILKASADAPIYFQTPVKISEDKFVDGGVGGNCPLSQALRMVTELFDRNTKVQLAVSIAPPKKCLTAIPDSQQWMYWLEWFPNQVSDGNIIYQECKMRYRYHDISFERLTPKSKDASKFNLDEQDVEAMIKCVETESEQDSEYFQSVMKTSCKLILASSLSKSPATLNAIYKILEMIGDTCSNFDDASDCHKWSLKALHALHGISEPHCDIVKCLNKIGKCMQELGQYNDALDCHSNAKKLNQQLFEDLVAHPITAASLINIGLCQLNLGRFSEALESSRQALEMLHKLYGDNDAHPDIAAALNSIGLCKQKLSAFNEALKYHLNALEIQRRVSGEDVVDADVAKSLNNIGICHQELSHYEEALTYHKNALQMRQQLYGEDKPHPSTAGSLNNVGNCLEQLEDYSKALEYLEKAFKMEKQLFGEDNAHPSTAASLNNIGSCYLDNSKYVEALDYFQKAMTMNQQLYGEDESSSKVILLNNIGVCKRNLHEYQEALINHKKALVMTQKLYGEDKPNPDTSESLNNIGICHQKFGNYDQALDNHKRALHMMQQLYGEDKAHADVATTLENISVCLQKIGRNDEAIDYRERALNMKQQLRQTPSPSRKINIMMRMAK